MMKKLLLISMLAVSGNVVLAQSDTLLYENFDVDPTPFYVYFNSGNDSLWVNFDADGLPDFNTRPQEWFWSDGAFATVDSVDACLFSSSWLNLATMLNRNWLMTPPIQIVDGSAILSWASAPRQTPRFVDGYSILVSTTDNLETSFTDTLFQAAQFIAGTGSDFANYTFSPGFVHGMDGTYTELDATNDSTRLVGILRPFTASLAQYAGQTIYIAFLHDSDDDNLIALDDILITGTMVGLNENEGDQDLSIFPNPSSSNIELSYHLASRSQVIAEIYDLKGAKVITRSMGLQIAGDQKLAIDISALAPGTYTVHLIGAGSKADIKFVKN